MASVKTVMCLAASVLVTTSLAAQSTVDFSGRWALAPDPVGPSSARSAAPMGTGWGPEITIAQNATTLTVEFPQFARGDMQPPIKLVYQLDGSESRNSINMGRGPQEQVAKASWDGPRLTINTLRTFAPAPGDEPMTLQTTHTLSLESPGTLVVETTHRAALGGRASTSRSTYKKIIGHSSFQGIPFPSFLHSTCDENPAGQDKAREGTIRVLPREARRPDGRRRLASTIETLAPRS